MLDIHSHILPGVDHGARDLKQAHGMLAAAAAQGIDRIVATPHVYHSDFDRSVAQHAHAALKPYAESLHIDLKLGYEFNTRAIDFDHMERANDFCIEGSNKLLLEFPFEHWPRDWKSIVYDLQANGLEIIIAHPERYIPIQQNMNILDKLADLDCLFQVDVPQSLHLFSKQNRVLKRLIQMGRLHYAASDAHAEADYEKFAKSIKRLEDYLQYDASV